jgi:hypothetical protein
VPEAKDGLQAGGVTTMRERDKSSGDRRAVMNAENCGSVSLEKVE